MDLLRHCTYVLAVVDEGSFTDAAISLGITQPPLSQGVRRLEAAWGVRLLERSARGVDLTAAGRRLLPVMRALVADAESLEARARDLGGRPGDLVCGVDPALGGVAESVVARLAVGREGQVRIRTDLPDRLVDAVRLREIDVAVVRHPVVLDGVLSTGPMVLETALLRPTTCTLAPGFPVPRGLPLALRPREECPAAHDLLWHEALRGGHDGRLVEAEHPVSWVAAGAAWTVLPTAALPRRLPGVVASTAPARLRWRAVGVARDQDLLGEVLTGLRAEADRD